MATLVVVLAMSYGRTGVDQRRDHAVLFDAAFEQVDGLAVDDPVYLAGIPVGRVTNFALMPDSRALTTLSVDSSIEVFADAAVAIHTDGLFGSKFVRLDPGGGSTKLLKDGDRIPYAQKAFMVSEVLNLIITQGRLVRDQMAPQAN